MMIENGTERGQFITFTFHAILISVYFTDGSFSKVSANDSSG